MSGADDKSSEANTHGSGQSVSIVQVTDGATKWLVVGAVAIIAFMLWTTHTASRAIEKAERAEKAATYYAGELRYAQAWMQAAYNAQMTGQKPPPIPANFIKK